MRIVAWNLLEGGLSSGVEGGPRPAEPARRSAARSLIDRLAPDVLVLNEALYAERHLGQLESYAEIFGFPHQCARLYDGAWGNAILSRWSIAETQCRLIHRKGGQNRGFLAGLVTPPGAAPVWISTYHPHPSRRPFKRAEDFREFLARFRGTAAILCGDLNAVSPEDQPDEAALVQNFLSFQKPGIAEASVHRMLEAGRLLFEEVLPEAGWRDGIEPCGRRSSMPTALIRKPGDLGLRIDHALVSPQIRVLSGAVIADPDADRASDHYPILLDIDP